MPRVAAIRVSKMIVDKGAKSSPTYWTVPGIVMCLIELYAKACREIDLRLLGKVIEVICDPRNASTPIQSNWELASKLILVIGWL
jgi:hypothetical protein